MARKLTFDRWLFSVPIGLTLFGLLMVYSASSVLSLETYGNPYHYLARQALAATAGLLIMGTAMFVPYTVLRQRWVSGPLLFASVLLLGAVLALPANQGVHRWLPLSHFHLQPSEVAKLAILIFLAGFLERRGARVGDFTRTLLPCLVAVGQVAVLIALEPDLGTCVMVLLTSFLVLYMGGIPYRQLAAVAAVCLLAVGALVMSAEYRVQRMTAFLHPEMDPQGAGFQARQSLLGFSSGGFSGRSLGEGQQKHFFLPEPHTDFIFSVVAEETGMMGAVGVLAAFAVILWRGLRAAARAPDRFGALLGTGLTLVLCLGALINMGVAMALLPTKGLPLPFISYGGSSLVCSLAAAGILLNLSQHST
jgi:cell division protein FtsW